MKSKLVNCSQGIVKLGIEERILGLHRMYSTHTYLRLCSTAALAGFFSLALSLKGHSATSDGNFAARGIGASTCASVVAALKGPEHDGVSSQLASWISGYLSHTNRTREGVYDIMPIQDAFGVATVLARICETNPEAIVEPTLVAVVKYLEGAEQTSVSDVATLKQNGQRAIVRESVLQLIFQRLIEKGFLDQEYQSDVFDNRAVEALAAFQRSTGLQETGLPDSVTIFLIFAD